MSLNIHIINHTHWDREWFLTHVYTNALIPRLIDRLAELVAANPSFQYLLDGQTLVIEDLLGIAAEYRDRVQRLVEDSNLLIGPYYCQPDWQMTCGEVLLRNLLYGLRDAAAFGAANKAGWLVDTFGHISQSPQIHRLFGIEAVYVWRGAPLLRPYFHWYSPDGSCVLAINLFGGYRNLYGVSQVPDVAVQRLLGEARRLRPYYPTPDIPLFDGYDLEDNPEDPGRFFREQTDLPADLHLLDSTPGRFAAFAATLPDLPTLTGELNSGKYGATFPGVFSTRTYLKVMAHDCEHLLYRLAEPIAALAALNGRPYPADRFEQWSRALLQNSVHDCLCGVSIDLVHEKMEYTYRQVFDGLLDELGDGLAYLLSDFAAGLYAVSTNPFSYRSRMPVGEQLLTVETEGVGVWPVREGQEILREERPVVDFRWQNDHYSATVAADGTVQLGPAWLGALRLRRERGDTYSEEPGEVLGWCRPREMVIEQRSHYHCVLRLTCEAEFADIQVTAIVRLAFDDSPLIRWSVELDSTGTNFRLEMIFQTGQKGEVLAGMPFDIVRRPTRDTDLLPRDLPPDLAAVLLGQREIGEVRTFPFHEFVALSDGRRTSAVLAKGLHSYQADDDGTLTLLLRRSLEWLTRSDLEHRVGDAGPFFYVPDARCERRVRHELAFVAGDFDVATPAFQALNAAFQNPPLLVRVKGGGSRRSWQFWREDLPLDSLHLVGDRILARVHHPGGGTHKLSLAYPLCDVWGNRQDETDVIPPKKIVTLTLGAVPQPSPASWPATVELLTPPTWRVGPNHSLPDPAIIARLHEKVAHLQDELEQIQARLGGSSGRQHRELEHRYYVLRRELYEYLLSARLNERKREMQGELTPAYLFEPDPEIMAIGLELNRMRIKRRIFDYVVQVP